MSDTGSTAGLFRVLGPKTKWSRQRWAISAIVLLSALLLSSGIPAWADVGVILNDSLDTSVARITGSGHSAVYLSGICPESPIKMRLCRPGEQGSVVSNYTSLGEDQSFEWNIVPLSVYLYGEEDPSRRPIFGTEKIKRVLEDRYRDKYLTAYCQGEACRTSDKSEWREMVGASLSRSLYIFVADSTREQDLELIEKFNSLPNENHFNGMTRNCADFTRKIVNTYFPHATGPDYINDFGMTSPKAVARSFTRYSLKHPEAHFRVLHIAQVPGTIKQSTESRTGTEQLFRSKKLLVPMLVFAAHELPIVVASYELTGRFNPQRQFENHPTATATDMAVQIKLAKKQGDDALASQLKTSQQQQIAEIVGTQQQWQDDRAAFKALLDEAVHEEIVPEHSDFKDMFKRFDAMGTAVADRNGDLWLNVSEGDKSSLVGISADNVLAAGSDPQLATGILIARIGMVLKNSKHRRETYPELKTDWDALQAAHARSQSTDADLADPLATKIHTATPERLVSWVGHHLS